MATIGECALCLTNPIQLMGSHIISELFYKHVYTPKHKLASISSKTGIQKKPEQKGYREYLLCSGCEGIFAKWEGVLAQTFGELISENYSKLRAVPVGRCIQFNGADYDSIKLGLLSILWRMSVSSLDIFSCYSLGPYQEKLRMDLLSKKHYKSSEYPLLISKATIGGAFHPGLLMPMSRGHYANKTIIQSVVLNSFVIDIHITETNKVSDEVLKFALNESGGFIMPIRDHADIGIDLQEFKKYTSSSEVSDFFKKHS